MASITASTFVLGHAQRNGTRYVTETHVWDSGLPPTGWKKQNKDGKKAIVITFDNGESHEMTEQ